MAQYIGETNKDYVNGEFYGIMHRPMVGRIYRPDKDKEGKYLDHVGVPDNRIMVWKTLFAKDAEQGYKVYTPQDFEKNWVL